MQLVAVAWRNAERSACERGSLARLTNTSIGEALPLVAPKKKGTLVVFDSLICHEVKPVISGVRYSAVKWVHGERPFK